MAKTKRQKQTAVQQREQTRPRIQEGSRQSIGVVPAKANNSRARRRVVAKRSPWPLILGILAVVALVVGIFVIFYNQQSPSAGSASTPTDPTTFKQVTQVDPDLLSQIGTGGLKSPFKTPKDAPTPLVGASGKPKFFYFGAEFCPYCAAQRWGVIVAISRFGTFSQLAQTISADAPEAYPNTSTFTFAKSSYSSSYIDFVAVESSDRQQQRLQTPTTSDQQMITTYDGPPYNSSAGSIPFINVGNKFLNYGPAFDPGVLRTNPQDPNSTPLSQKEIASQIASGNALSKGILGTANYFTAAICMTTNNQPSAVCSATTIQQIETTLPKASGNSNQLANVTSPAPMDILVRKQNVLG